MISIAVLIALAVAIPTVGYANEHLGGTARTPIYEGSHDSAERTLRERGSPEWKSTQASAAISSLLRREKLTIIAQGPLTNIATVIINYPKILTGV